MRVLHAHRIGVAVVTGTDAGSILTPHGRAGREVADLGRIGSTAQEAIRATIEMSARLLKIVDRLGKLCSGRLADLVIVKGGVEADLALLEGSGNVLTVMLERNAAFSRTATVK